MKPNSEESTETHLLSAPWPSPLGRHRAATSYSKTEDCTGATGAKKGALSIDDVGVAVEDTDGSLGCDTVAAHLDSGKDGGGCLGAVAEGVGGVEFVAGIEETEKVAGGKTDAFVHGIVEPLVGFANDDGMGIASGNLHGAVF